MINPNDRIEKLLSVLVLQSMKDEPVAEKIQVLHSAGIGNADIAALLRTTPHAVSQALYQARKPTKRSATTNTRGGR